MMPRTIDVEGDMRSVATEEELLEFANEIRKAGGADVIEALLPSEPGEPHSCLIANALNFKCEVRWEFQKWFADGSHKWRMNLPHNLTDDQRKSLGRVKGVRLRYDDYSGQYYLTLPRHIGNAAAAFDAGDAFQEYARA